MPSADVAKPALTALAERVGILSEYVDQSGTERRATSDRTRVALLRCLGIDAATEASCRAELQRLDANEQRQPIDGVRVVRGEATTIPLRRAEQWAGARFRLSLFAEGPSPPTTPVTIEGRIDPARASLPLPSPAGLGYHRVRLELSRDDATFEQTLIVATASCVRPSQLLDGQKGAGITAQLYSLVSARNQGIGDLTDLATLARWAGERGASFVGVNPLHVLHNRGSDISPYSPISRIFKNPIYLDVLAIPELAASDEARALLAAPAVQAELARVRATSHVDYAAVRALKWPLLRALHRTFRRTANESARGRAYRVFVEDEGKSLTDYATFMALAESRLTQGASDWHGWPAALRRPDSAEVRAFAEAHAEEVDFQRYLQLELDRQLAVAAAAAKDAGMRVGLYQDLAIGSAPGSSDSWAFPELFVDGASIGAPPDGYSADGQNWGLPPLNPWALAADSYRYFIRVVRAALRHAGAIRIDHAVGLFRQFWVPAGMSGKDGAYVRFPADDLLGILALESQRHRALVVGEDLGTVPPEVPPALHARGILSSRVLYFERDDDGHFHPSSEYEPDSLTTANTHDMPTLAGYWQGRDITIHREVGMVESDAEMQRLQAERAKERRELVARLAAEGLVREPAQEPAQELDASAMRAAVSAFLNRTPASLVGVSLDDIVGEVEPVNLPGVAPERFASWTRKSAVAIEDLPNVPFDGRRRSGDGE